MEFPAAPSAGRWVGLGLVIAGLAVVGALLLGVKVHGVGPMAATYLVLAAVAAVVTALVAYWVWGLWRLNYHVSRDGVVIAAPGGHHVIPMDDITALGSGRAYESPLRGLRWPGFWHGRASIRDDQGVLCNVLVNATRPPAEQLIVMTPGLAYAISPSNPSEFMEDFAMRRRLGVLQPLRQQTTRSPRLAGTMLGDGVARVLVAAGLLINAVAILLVVYRFPTLPVEVPLRFEYDSVRRAAIVVGPVPRANVWSLPLIGLAVAVLNGTLAWLAYPRARLVALLLAAGVIAVQIALLVMLGRVLF